MAEIRCLLLHGILIANRNFLFFFPLFIIISSWFFNYLLDNFFLYFWFSGLTGFTSNPAGNNNNNNWNFHVETYCIFLASFLTGKSPGSLTTAPNQFNSNLIQLTGSSNPGAGQMTSQSLGLLHSGHGTGLDALSQAYSKIQQQYSNNYNNYRNI